MRLGRENHGNLAPNRIRDYMPQSERQDRETEPNGQLDVDFRIKFRGQIRRLINWAAIITAALTGLAALLEVFK